MAPLGTANEPRNAGGALDLQPVVARFYSGETKTTICPSLSLSDPIVDYHIQKLKSNTLTYISVADDT